MNKTAAAVLLGLVLSTGCTSEPKWKKVYARCQESVAQGGQVSEKDAGAMAQTMGAMVQSMGGVLCDKIRKICEPDPEGTACTAIVNNAKF